VKSYKIGDSFVKLPLDKVQELLQQSTSEVDVDVEELEGRLDKIREEMTGLKSALYGRFGKSINLEA